MATLSNEEYKSKRDALDKQLNDHTIGQTQYEAELKQLDDQYTPTVVRSSAQGLSSIVSLQDKDNTKPMNDSAVVESHKYYNAILEKYNSGELTDDMIQNMGRAQNVDVSSILDFVHMSALQREQTPEYKDDLSASAGYPTKLFDEVDSLKPGESVVLEGCEISCDYDSVNILGIDAWKDTEKVKYHCKSDYLGEFDYDPNEYAIGYKEVKEKDGSISKLPVLKYIGTGKNVQDIEALGSFDSWLNKASDAHLESYAVYIPDGVKCIDYTFEGCKDLKYIRSRFPESVESMHCAFKGCESLELVPDHQIGVEHYKDGFVNVSYDLYLPMNLRDCSQAFEGCKKFHCDVKSVDYDAAAEHKLVDPSFDIEYHRSGAKTFLEYMSYVNPLGGVLRVPMLVKDIADSAYASEIYKMQLPYQTRNATNMFSGCDAMDATYESGMWWRSSPNSLHEKVKYGDIYTPFLAPELARGIYDDIADKTAAIATDGAAIAEGGNGRYWKDGTGIEFTVQQDKNGAVNKEIYDKLTDEEKKEVEKTQATQILLENGKTESGAVNTDVELVSAGWITNNKLEDGTYDSSGLKNSHQDKKERGNFWEQLVVDGATGLGLFAVSSSLAKGLTGSKLFGKLTGAIVGIGGTLLLVDKLPDSLYPVVDWTVQHLPDGTVKDALTTLRDKLPSADAYEFNKSVDEYNSKLDDYNDRWEDPLNVAKELYDKRLTMFVKDSNLQNASSSLTDSGLFAYMKNNGAACAQSGTFYAVADNGEESAKCVSDVMKATLSARASVWQAEFKSGELSDKMKQEMANYYLTTMKALKEYNDGATALIDDVCHGSLRELQLEGLNMVNRAYTAEVMASLQAMNNKYHFMTPDVWNQMSAIDIKGVDMKSLKTYNASSFDSAKAASASHVQSLQTSFNAEREAAEAKAREETVKESDSSVTSVTSEKDADTSKSSESVTESKTSSDTKDVSSGVRDGSDLDVTDEAETVSEDIEELDGSGL